MKIFLTIALLISFMSFTACAEEPYVIKATNLKAKILLIGFTSQDPMLQSDLDTIFNQINFNLKNTDLFEIVRSDTSYEEYERQLNEIDKNKENQTQITKLNIIPNFAKYKKTGYDEIIVAEFRYSADQQLEAKIRSWDVFDEKQLFGKFYSAKSDGYKKMADLIAEEVFKSTTGERVGHFNSKILYVSLSGSAQNRIRKICLIDFDGGNRRELTNGKDLVLTPTFAKKSGEIFYLRYYAQRPQIYSLNVNTLRSQKIGEFQGTTFAPAVHPKDPNLLLLSAIINGNSDIYEMDISKNIATRLTKDPGIDTTPSYSPKGEYIIFSSDRGGIGQQIYLLDYEKMITKRISRNSGSYSKPVWSPDGNLIAFTKVKSNQFSIGVMEPDGKNERTLTTGYVVEGAKWSPNGRYLIYSKQKGPYGENSIPRLYILDVITQSEREIPTPKNEGATDPDWSSNWRNGAVVENNADR